MARFLKSKKETIGLSPDDLYYSGEQKEANPRLRLINYNSEKLNEIELEHIHEAADYNKTGTTTWINVDGLHDVNLMKELSNQFEISSHIMADVLEVHNRPQIHEYDNCLYISTKMLHYNETEEEVSSENLVLIIKENLLISFQEKEGDVFDPVRERLRKSKKRIRRWGPDYLAFALLDVVIDNYLQQISRLGDKIEDLDEKLIENPSAETIEMINNYKSEINYLRKTIKPCREMILKMCKLDSDFLGEGMPVYLSELQNNIELANDSVDSYRDILSDQLNIFHTTVSHKLNEILKFLTIFSVIFIPITFIVGVYGTNFDHIPELHYKYSYFIMWGVIIAVVVTMIVYFKKKKWL